MDVSVLESRLNLSFDYFIKQSKDLLFQKTLPGFFGGGRGNKAEGGTTWVNQGQVDNKGFEMLLTAYPLSNASPLQWETSLIASYVNNKIVDLAGDDDIQTHIRSDLGGSAMIMKVGYPYGSFFLYPMKGFDDNGAYLYEKADGTLVTNPTPGDDQVIMGNALPKWTFGWNNSLRWQNWTVNIFFNGAAGYNRLHQSLYAISSMTGPYRFIMLRDAYLKGWDKVSDKAQAEYPNYKNGEGRYLYNGDKWLENASFVKLKNMSIAYDIPREIIQFADLQLSLSGQNLFTITKYKGLDPEGDAIDHGAYPLPRTYTVGLRVTF